MLNMVYDKEVAMTEFGLRKPGSVLGFRTEMRTSPSWPSFPNVIRIMSFSLSSSAS